MNHGTKYSLAVISVCTAGAFALAASACGGMGGIHDSPDGSTAEDAGADTGCINTHDANVDAPRTSYDLALQFSDTINGGSNPWSYGYALVPGGPFTPFTINGEAGAVSAASWFYTGVGVCSTCTTSGGALSGWNSRDQFIDFQKPYYPYVLKNTGDTPYVLTGNSPNDPPAALFTIAPGQVAVHDSSDHVVAVRFTAPAGLPAGTIYARFDRLQVSNIAYGQTVGVILNGTSLFTTVLSGNGASTSFASPSMDLKAGDIVDFFEQGAPDAEGAVMAVTAHIE